MYVFFSTDSYIFLCTVFGDEVGTYRLLSFCSTYWPKRGSRQSMTTALLQKSFARSSATSKSC